MEKIVIRKLDHVVIPTVNFYPGTFFFPALILEARVGNTPVKVIKAGGRLKAYVGRNRVFDGSLRLLGTIPSRCLGLAGIIIDFLEALRNRPAAEGAGSWGRSGNGYAYDPGEAPNVIWDAIAKLRPIIRRNAVPLNPRGPIQNDRFLPKHLRRQRVKVATALAKGHEITGYLSGGFCIALVEVREHWQGPCRREAA
jgi:hypothetical protein